jgi:hypothetical protein
MNTSTTTTTPGQRLADPELELLLASIDADADALAGTPVDLYGPRRVGESAVEFQARSEAAADILLDDPNILERQYELLVGAVEASLPQLALLLNFPTAAQSADLAFQAVAA